MTKVVRRGRVGETSSFYSADLYIICLHLVRGSYLHSTIGSALGAFLRVSIKMLLFVLFAFALQRV